MIHNINTRVKDEMIKSMKPESMLQDILAVAKSFESKVNHRYRLTLSISDNAAQVREVANTGPIQTVREDP